MSIEGEGWIEKGKKVVENLPNDPTKSLIILPPDANLQFVGRNSKDNAIVEHEESGRRFHQVVNSGADQMFATRLLKGILPVSDVNNTKSWHGLRTRYYSYETPTQDIAANESYTSEDVRAAADLILYVIFRDWDHAQKRSDNNFKVDTSNDAIVLFDFGQTSDFWRPLAKEAVRAGISPEQLLERMSAIQKKCTLEMLTRLQERYAGEEGLRFVSAILDDMHKRKAETPEMIAGAKSSSEEKVQAFHTELLRRVDSAIAIVGDKLREQETSGSH